MVNETIAECYVDRDSVELIKVNDTMYRVTTMRYRDELPGSINWADLELARLNFIHTISYLLLENR